MTKGWKIDREDEMTCNVKLEDKDSSGEDSDDEESEDQDGSEEDSDNKKSGIWLFKYTELFLILIMRILWILSFLSQIWKSGYSISWKNLITANM